MSTILVPLDGSPLAEQVLPYVRLLATTLALDVRLLRVVTEREQGRALAEDDVTIWDDTRPPRYERVEQAQQVLGLDATAYLEGLAQTLREQGLAVSVAVHFGHPAELISQLAAEEGGSALIAMATHGYGGLRRWALGSVTDRVVHSSPVPVFVVRSSQGPSPHVPKLSRLLLPLDGSPLAERAIDLSLKIAGRAQAELLLLRVVEPPFIAADTFTIAQYGYLLEFEQNEAQTYLEERRRELRPQHPGISSVVTVGYPAECIVDEAEARQVDLIVMATHGQSGLRRWALGSVADKVLHATQTPLLLVRGEAR
jgi:nucleotide-binding universal stress UspA family protein